MIGFCKPNLRYYKELLRRTGFNASRCLMIGNDVDEDMITAELGMKVFLLTACLINRSRRDISVYPHGSYSELNKYLDNLIE